MSVIKYGFLSLLGMIMEKASGLTLKQIYEQKFFAPLGRESAYYGTDGQAGYGLYYEEYEYGPTIGHGGGVVGWEAGMDYFSDHDVTLIKMTNTDLILTTEAYDNNFNSFSINLKKAIFDAE